MCYREYTDNVQMFYFHFCNFKYCVYKISIHLCVHTLLYVCVCVWFSSCRAINEYTQHSYVLSPTKVELKCGFLEHGTLNAEVILTF
jgi:hypothetical protein